MDSLHDQLRSEKVFDRYISSTIASGMAIDGLTIQSIVVDNVPIGGCVSEPIVAGNVYREIACTIFCDRQYWLWMDAF